MSYKLKSSHLGLNSIADFSFVDGCTAVIICASLLKEVDEVPKMIAVRLVKEEIRYGATVKQPKNCNLLANFVYYTVCLILKTTALYDVKVIT